MKEMVVLSSLQLQWIYHGKERMMLREFLRENRISKQALTDIKFRGGLIKVNDKEETVRYFLNDFDRVTVVFPNEERSKNLLAENMPIDIIYEDSYFLICNKPPGMNTIPSREWPISSLANHVLGYYNSINLPSSIHMVNRLDRDTSGALIIAKYRHIHYLFSIQQKNIEVKRRYIALVHGKVQKESGSINFPIGRSDDSIIERMVREDGQEAVTHYEVLCQNDEYSLVSIVLETGRTHQIRVHFSHIGHPLVGDDLYGGKREIITRQALHSFEVEGIHPFTDEPFKSVAPLPNDMERVLIDLFGKEVIEDELA